MSTGLPPSPPASSAASLSLAQRLLIGAIVLWLLHVGRDVLEPLTLAVMLSFVLAPLVRRFRRLGLRQAPAALATLAVVGVLASLVGVLLLAQLSAMSRELPQYEVHVRDKVGALRELTVDQWRQARQRAGRLIGEVAPGDTPPSNAAPVQPKPATTPAGAAAGGPAGTSAPLPDEAQSGLLALRELALSLWGPLGTVGVVVLVLVFALLEQDALRDRLVSLMGGKDVRAATSALNDAAQRLSRYFVSQVSVNLGVALVIGLLLALLGVPHAAVWAVLAGLLRFVPYVGFPLAALLAAAMAAVMAPGWDLMWTTLLVFVGVELVVAHVVEPQLYGHATGLSAFSVVVAAVFWGALWGPVGLLLSTPLTLCLVVAGRHVPALAFLDTLLGDGPALSLSQRFYQRSLSGDAVEILADARTFLKRRSLAAYYDKVVLPAFELARQDLQKELISPEQRATALQVVWRVFEELLHAPRLNRPLTTVLTGGDLGLHLRGERLQREGRWQGSLQVPPGSVHMCVSLDDPDSHLMAEILVRLLRLEHLDARHVTLQDLAEAPPEAAVASVGAVLVLGTSATLPSPEQAQLLGETLQALAHAPALSVLPPLPSDSASGRDPIAPEHPHQTAYSLEEALALVQAWR